MKIYLPMHLKNYLKDLPNIQIITHSDHIEVDLDIDSNTIIDIFYKGAEYGADQMYETFKENLGFQVNRIKFDLN